jgi:hypothetical protein
MSKSNLTRRALVASTAAVPAAAALSLPVIAAAEPDPIFAAIEAHRKARAETDARNDDACKLEAEWFRRRSSPDDRDEALDAAREVEQQAFDRASNIAGILINTEPTTIAGVCALLTHYADLEVIDNGMLLPDFEDDADDPAVGELGASAGYFVARTVCRALAKITGCAACRLALMAPGRHRSPGALTCAKLGRFVALGAFPHQPPRRAECYYVV